MLEYQKKVGRKHKITPRNKRTRSQLRERKKSVPDDEVNKAVVMMAGTGLDLVELTPIERLEKMINGMCNSIKEVQGQMNTIQNDVAQIKKMQLDHYENLDKRLADCQQENEDLKTQLNVATDRIDTLELCYGKTYSLREKAKKERKAYNYLSEVYWRLTEKGCMKQCTNY